MCSNATSGVLDRKMYTSGNHVSFSYWNVVFLWPHELLLEQVFPKHMARAEKTPFVDDHVLGFQGLKRLQNFQLK
jgi:hypothetical protein